VQRIGQDFTPASISTSSCPGFSDRARNPGAEGGSLWITEGDISRCRLAMGGASQRLVGAEMPGHRVRGDVAGSSAPQSSPGNEGPRFDPARDPAGDALPTTVNGALHGCAGPTVGAIQSHGKRTGDGSSTSATRALRGLAASAAIVCGTPAPTATSGARLALLLAISREITATLDLDRVLRSVVNLSRARFQFDRGAIALYDKGHCDIRAIAGQEQVDRDDPKLQASRCARPGRRAGESFYLPTARRPHRCGDGPFYDLRPASRPMRIVSGLYLRSPTKRAWSASAVRVARAQLFTETQRGARDDPGKPDHGRAAQRAALRPGPAGGCVQRDRRAETGVLEIPLASACCTPWAAPLCWWRSPDPVAMRVSGTNPCPARLPHRPSVACAESSTGAGDRGIRRRPRRAGAPAPGWPSSEPSGMRRGSGPRGATAAAQGRKPGDRRRKRLQRIADGDYRRSPVLETAGATLIGPGLGPGPHPRPGERLGPAGGATWSYGRAYRHPRARVRGGPAGHRRVAPGQEVRLRVDALPQRTFAVG